ncbi:MAG TPA: hypothetical protein PLY34_17085 [Ferruginibacter sp.]|nr:hypothetical protein [Ferruginibacter sp.]
MKITLLKMLATALCCSIVFVSCKKDDPVDNTPEKVKKMLFDWKIKSISVPKAGQPTVDSALTKVCMNDDVIRFNKTAFDFQDAANKCDSTIFYYSKGSWVYDLTNDSLKLNATNPAKYVSWKVVTLNDSVLKVRFVDSLNPAQKLNKTIEFKK